MLLGHADGCRQRYVIKAGVSMHVGAFHQGGGGGGGGGGGVFSTIYFKRGARLYSRDGGRCFSMGGKTIKKCNDFQRCLSSYSRYIITKCQFIAMSTNDFNLAGEIYRVIAMHIAAALAACLTFV